MNIRCNIITHNPNLPHCWYFSQYELKKLDQTLYWDCQPFNTIYHTDYKVPSLVELVQKYQKEWNLFLPAFIYLDNTITMDPEKDFDGNKEELFQPCYYLQFNKTIFKQAQKDGTPLIIQRAIELDASQIRSGLPVGSP